MVEDTRAISASAAGCKAPLWRNWAVGGSLVLTVAAVLQVAVDRWHGMTTSSHTIDSNAQVAAFVPRIQEPWLAPDKALRDFPFLRDRLVEEYGWEQSRSEGAIVEYLRFLTMLGESPRMELIASSDLDLVWHEHLQDTLNYAEDCRSLFGRFLHHRRARTSEEKAAIPESYGRTKRRYAERFGAEPSPQFWGAATEASSMCGGGPSLLGNTPARQATTGNNTVQPNEKPSILSAAATSVHPAATLTMAALFAFLAVSGSR
jgi:hypothetical protein